MSFARLNETAVFSFANESSERRSLVTVKVLDATLVANLVSVANAEHRFVITNKSVGRQT